MVLHVQNREFLTSERVLKPKLPAKENSLWSRDRGHSLPGQGIRVGRVTAQGSDLALGTRPRVAAVKNPSHELPAMRTDEIPAQDSTEQSER